MSRQPNLKSVVRRNATNIKTSQLEDDTLPSGNGAAKNSMPASIDEGQAKLKEGLTVTCDDSKEKGVGDFKEDVKNNEISDAKCSEIEDELSSFVNSLPAGEVDNGKSSISFSFARKSATKIAAPSAFGEERDSVEDNAEPSKESATEMKEMTSLVDSANISYSHLPITSPSKGGENSDKSRVGYTYKKVWNKDGTKELDWLECMIFCTQIEPHLEFSINPMMYDFVNMAKFDKPKFSDVVATCIKVEAGVPAKIDGANDAVKHDDEANSEVLETDTVKEIDTSSHKLSKKRKRKKEQKKSESEALKEDDGEGFDDETTIKKKKKRKRKKKKVQKENPANDDGVKRKKRRKSKKPHSKDVEGENPADESVEGAFELENNSAKKSRKKRSHKKRKKHKSESKQYHDERQSETVVKTENSADERHRKKRKKSHVNKVVINYNDEEEEASDVEAGDLSASLNPPKIKIGSEKNPHSKMDNVDPPAQTNNDADKQSNTVIGSSSSDSKATHTDSKNKTPSSHNMNKSPRDASKASTSKSSVTSKSPGSASARHNKGTTPEEGDSKSSQARKHSTEHAADDAVPAKLARTNSGGAINVKQEDTWSKMEGIFEDAGVDETNKKSKWETSDEDSDGEKTEAKSPKGKNDQNKSEKLKKVKDSVTYVKNPTTAPKSVSDQMSEKKDNPKDSSPGKTVPCKSRSRSRSFNKNRHRSYSSSSYSNSSSRSGSRRYTRSRSHSDSRSDSYHSRSRSRRSYSNDSRYSSSSHSSRCSRSYSRSRSRHRSRYRSYSSRSHSYRSRSGSSYSRSSSSASYRSRSYTRSRSWRSRSYHSDSSRSSRSSMRSHNSKSKSISPNKKRSKSSLMKKTLDPSDIPLPIGTTSKEKKTKKKSSKGRAGVIDIPLPPGGEDSSGKSSQPPPEKSAAPNPSIPIIAPPPPPPISNLTPVTPAFQGRPPVQPSFPNALPPPPPPPSFERPQRMFIPGAAPIVGPPPRGYPLRPPCTIPPPPPPPGGQTSAPRGPPPPGSSSEKEAPPPLPPPKSPSPKPPPPPKKEEKEEIQPRLVLGHETLQMYSSLAQRAMKHAEKNRRRQERAEKGLLDEESSDSDSENEENQAAVAAEEVADMRDEEELDLPDSPETIIQFPALASPALQPQTFLIQQPQHLAGPLTIPMGHQLMQQQVLIPTSMGMAVASHPIPMQAGAPLVLPHASMGGVQFAPGMPMMSSVTGLGSSFFSPGLAASGHVSLSGMPSLPGLTHGLPGHLQGLIAANPHLVPAGLPAHMAGLHQQPMFAQVPSGQIVLLNRYPR